MSATEWDAAVRVGMVHRTKGNAERLARGIMENLRGPIAEGVKVDATGNDDGTVIDLPSQGTPMTKDGLSAADLIKPLKRLNYSIHGDTHTATIIVEQSIELRFTPFEGEDPYDALQRVIINCGYEPVRQSEPRRR